MKTTRKKDPFAAYYGAKEVPETDIFCAICKDEISTDKETISIGNNICHLECFEKEIKNGSKETC